jgi:hypothetical protein
MAKDDLTGNMPTEIMLDWFNENNIATGIDAAALTESLIKTSSVFPL